MTNSGIVPQVDIDAIAKRNGISVAQVQRTLNRAHKAMTPFMKRVSVVESGRMHWFSVERRGLGLIKTPQGNFWIYDFLINDQWEKYSVIVKTHQLDEELMPMFVNKERLVFRIDSGCETGQLFGDLTCDCLEQLHKAMQTLTETGEGLIVNIPNQDGRGMSLPFKLATLTLQVDLHLNTVESASMLAPGGVIDVRTYAGVICILKFFKIPTSCALSLASNNPKKALVFSENGYNITDMLPVIIPPTEDTRHHLLAKQEHLGHRNLVEDVKTEGENL